MNTKYQKQKQNIALELTNFLSVSAPSMSLDNVTPSVMREYLVWKDGTGKTIVHRDSCPGRDSFSFDPCSCPRRRASSSVDTLIGQLRAIFRDLGRGSDWNISLGIGNPMASPCIQRHLKAVRIEQTRSLVQDRQAVPIFIDKVIRICRMINYRLLKSTLTLKARYSLIRDRAYFCLLSFTGNRAGDLGRVKYDQVRWLENNSGFYIHITEGKTVLTNPRSVILSRLEGSELCPVAELERYLNELGKLGLDFKGGYLFRPCAKSGGCIVSNTYVSASTMNPRLRKLLIEAGLWNGETPHSFRGGCAMMLKMMGVSDDDIKSHVGWSSEKMLKRYTAPLNMSAKTNSTVLVGEFSHLHSPAASLSKVSRTLRSWKSLKKL